MRLFGERLCVFFLSYRLSSLSSSSPSFTSWRTNTHGTHSQAPSHFYSTIVCVYGIVLICWINLKCFFPHFAFFVVVAVRLPNYRGRRSWTISCCDQTKFWFFGRPFSYATAHTLSRQTKRGRKSASQILSLSVFYHIWILLSNYRQHDVAHSSLVLQMNMYNKLSDSWAERPSTWCVPKSYQRRENKSTIQNRKKRLSKWNAHR